MSDTSPVALDLRDHVVFESSGAVTVPIADGSELSLSLACLEPGQVLDARIASGDRLLTVIGGRAWVVVDDAEVVLAPLQAVLVPDGAAHGVRNDSADPLILQVVGRPDPDAVATGHARADDAADGEPPYSTDPLGQEAAPRLGRLRRLLGSG